MNQTWNVARTMAVRLGDGLRDERRRRELSLAGLAEMTGVAVSTLSRIETGQMIPTVQAEQALTRFFTETPLQTSESNEPVWLGGYPRNDDITWTVGHARMGDPRSSESTVRSIDADTDLHELIMDAARVCEEHTLGMDGQPIGAFDDTDLWRRVETVTGRRFQRNVIARARGRLERQGRFIRFGPIERDDRERSNIHYYIGDTPNG